MSYAFVFPGQGSQSVGMLADLASAHDEVKDTFAEASDALGYDLWKLVQEGPEESLNSTERTQPALLAAGVAVWRVLAENGVKRPEIMAGHSLGEYSALVCAGALDFADAIRLVEFRGQAMQEAVPAGTGAMAAILGLADDDVRAVCEASANGEVVSAVNFNAPGQVVIAGNKAAVERAVEAAKEKGAKRAIELPVSVPSHCSLMQPAADKMAERLKDVKIVAPKVPVIHNVDVERHSDPEEIRQALVAQLHSPVRWVETIEMMSDDGILGVAECGPGKVLAGLNRRIDKTMDVYPVFDVASLEKTLDALGD
ncbi:MAG: ACP S-malonyltransferase [Gammaproteobacteria bacterium]|nr:ACP S-malonyltransferase [Gammaproteobacteria bacterium]